MHPGAGAYICGEETALIEALEGKRGFPRIKPPFFPAVTGLYGEPTVVNNVETMSNLPWIINNGGAAFAALGGGRSTGTRLFALAGRVNNPGVFEIEMVKNTFRDLIYDPAARRRRHRRQRRSRRSSPAASRPRGSVPSCSTCPLGQDEVAEKGSMLGSGSIVVMDETTCVVRAAWRITKFFSRESCGQCTPCREGSGWIERAMYRIEHGGGRMEDIDLLLDLCDNIAPGLTWPPQQTTICVLGSVDPLLGPLGDPDVPRRLRRARDRTAGAPMTDVIRSTVTITVNGRSIEANARRAAHRGGRARRHLRAALLLPPAHGAGRHLSHVPRRSRLAARRDPAAGLLLEGQRRHERRHRLREGEEGPGRRPRVPARQSPPRLPGL